MDGSLCRLSISYFLYFLFVANGTVKIKNLKKKGNYNAVIKFAGNKYYKATSKKAKITIK